MGCDADTSSNDKTVNYTSGINQWLHLILN
jgi:hypothetical protein